MMLFTNLELKVGKTMKQIILFLTVVLITACSTSTVINDTTTYAVVENIHNSNSSKYKYVVTAWQYQPKIKKYEIHTDSLYKINSFIKIKNKQLKEK